MKLVYMGDSKSPVARRVGSSPTAGTTLLIERAITNKPTFSVGFFMPKIYLSIITSNTLPNIFSHFSLVMECMAAHFVLICFDIGKAGHIFSGTHA